MLLYNFWDIIYTLNLTHLFTRQEVLTHLKHRVIEPTILIMVTIYMHLLRYICLTMTRLLVVKKLKLNRKLRLLSSIVVQTTAIRFSCGVVVVVVVRLSDSIKIISWLIWINNTGNGGTRKSDNFTRIISGYTN